jgi:hypothetical protein
MFLGTVGVLTVAGLGCAVFVIERSAPSCAALMLAKARRNMRMAAARKEFRFVRIFTSLSAA